MVRSGFAGEAWHGRIGPAVFAKAGHRRRGGGMSASGADGALGRGIAGSASLGSDGMLCIAVAGTGKP